LTLFINTENAEKFLFSQSVRVNQQHLWVTVWLTPSQCCSAGQHENQSSFTFPLPRPSARLSLFPFFSSVSCISLSQSLCWSSAAV